MMQDVPELSPIYLSVFDIAISPYLDVFEELPSLDSSSLLPKPLSVWLSPPSLSVLNPPHL
jgi:hypothetical protein